MTKEKWKKITGEIEDKFSVEDKGSEHLDEEGGVDIEYIVFKGPLGKMRLEFITRPVVIDKKTIYSRRIGSGTAVEYVYSEDEKSQALHTYKWDEREGDWVEIDAASFED